MDIALVAMGCFTFVCSASRWRETAANRTTGRHCYCVEIDQFNGGQVNYRTEETSLSADDIRDELVLKMVGRPAAKIAVVRWFQESSEIYALSTLTPSTPTASPSNGVFQPAAMRTSDASDSSRAKGWRDFWNRRENAASTWLAEQETNRQQKIASLGSLIRVREYQPWLPSRHAILSGLLLAGFSVLIGTLWRWICPPVSLRSDANRSIAFAQPVKSAAESIAGATPPAAMCFRESWVKARQPANVLLRGTIGWTIVAGAAWMTAAAFVQRLL